MFMKSSTLLQPSTDAFNYTVLQRNSIKDNYQQTQRKEFSRRASRKNLLIFTLVYGICMCWLLSALF